MSDFWPQVFVYGVLGLGIISWIIAFICWADSRASAFDVYWGLLGLFLAGALAPFLAAKYPSVPSAALIISVFSYGGIGFLIMSALLTITSFLLAISCFSQSRNAQLWIAAGDGHGHGDAHGHGAGHGHAGDAGAHAGGDAHGHEDHHAHGQRQIIAGSAFMLLFVAMLCITIGSIGELFTGIARATIARPWSHLYSSASLFDKELGATFLPEASPFYALYIPGNRLHANDEAAVLQDVRNSLTAYKLNYSVGALVGMVLEDRGVATDRIVIYQEIDPNMPPNDPRRVKNIRSVRFRNPTDLQWIENVALGIDSIRTSMKVTGTAATMTLNQLGFPAATAMPNIGQHSVVRTVP